MREIFRFFMKMGLFLFCTIPLTMISYAQIKFEITGVNTNKIPIAITDFSGEKDISQKITEIIKTDLIYSDIFMLTHTKNMLLNTANVNLIDSNDRSADLLVLGNIQRHTNGNFEVYYRLFDNVQKKQLSALAFSSQSGLIRLIAHKIADDIYEKFTGIRGIFSTYIAYVTHDNMKYNLKIAHIDGKKTQTILSSSEPIISPTWSPDGKKIAYVSFETQKPAVYIQDITTRQRTLIANFKGSNSAPTWSPDSSKLALALTYNGITQVYIININNNKLRQLTNTDGIATEPQFSPNGNYLYFTGDHGGDPQIYKINLETNEIQRITFNGNYNISPHISPDNKIIAYISRRHGKFQLYALNLTNNQEYRVSDTDQDESPSFSPNGKYILYMTKYGSHEFLVITIIDDILIKRPLITQIDTLKDPTWGPFIK